MDISKNGRTNWRSCQGFFKKVEKSREILLKIKKYEDEKCYKITIKIEVKLKFWKLRRPCKIRTSSFREYTYNNGGAIGVQYEYKG